MQIISFADKKLSVDEAFKLALELLGQNRFLEVADLCQKIVIVDPCHFRAHHGIGIGLARSGRAAEAVVHIRQAIALNPEYFEAYNNLGNILRENGNPAEALELFQKGKALRPEAPFIHYNIARALNDLNRIDEAVSSYREAMRLNPDYFDAAFSLAICLQKLDRFAEACTCYRKALHLNPDHPDARYGLASCCQALGKSCDAEAEYRTLLQRNPNHPDALYAYATLQKQLKRPKEAYEHFKRLLSLNPERHDALLSIANLLNEQISFGKEWAQEEALQYYRRAVAVKQEDFAAHNTIGNLLLSRGEIDEAIDEYRQAVALKPDDPTARSCLLMSSQYHPAPSMAELHKESLLWSEFCAADTRRTTDHINLRDPERPLRIGYVSADLNMHPVGFYLLPVLCHHDAEMYRVYCYSNSKESDDFTARLRSHADGWRDVADLKDRELHDLIIRDGIDILVDLSGHTGGNRLLVFARKPAPLQVTWIGFFFTTGLKEIDYILMDETAVLSGEEQYFSEKVIRLPETRFCYEPPKAVPEVAPLPAMKNGYLTFGSFNSLAKVTPAVIHAWSAIIRTVPNSRLLLKSHSLGSDAVKERITRQFLDEGISPERLTLRGVSPHIEMLAEYGDMDIALDPFPFNGGLTSCEALWMGVPVLTMIGNRPIARQTAGFLNTIRLEGFIGNNERECCDLAVTWSNDLSGLEDIRRGLRSKMTASLLCDGRRFTANLEQTYRGIWRNWCSSMSPD